jgi:glucose-6-phosphate isomerase
MQDRHLRDLFADDSARGERMTAEAAGIFLDYSKNRVDEETLRLLLELAEQCGLRARIDAMFRGEKINVTEDRAVIGPEHFGAMLEGFHAVDEHFRTAPFGRNLPVLMGLLSVW